MNYDKGYLRIFDGEHFRRRIRISLIRGVNYRLGICEQLRCIYDTVTEFPDGPAKEKITEQLVDALIMGKRMTERLVYYKTKYNDTTGHGGKNLINPHGHRARIKMRKARIVP